MVGRLVHDQQVGGGQQQAGQGHPHSPAAGHFAHGAVVVGGVEAQSGQDAMGLGLDGIAAELLEPGLGLSVVGQQAFCLGA